MKLSTLLLSAAFAISVSAEPSWMPKQVTVSEDFKVPGDNPLYFCADPRGDLLEIENVDLDPNPPRPYVCPALFGVVSAIIVAWFLVPLPNALEFDHVWPVANTVPSGETLTIKAKGDFKEKIEEGAKVHLHVKYGLITLINQEADLCDSLGNVDLKCPLEKGEMTLTKDVDLPAQIPPVRHTAPTLRRMELTTDREHTRCWPTYSPRTALKSPAYSPRSHSPGKDLRGGKDESISSRTLSEIRRSSNTIKFGKRKFELKGPGVNIVANRPYMRNEL